MCRVRRTIKYRKDENSKNFVRTNRNSLLFYLINGTGKAWAWQSNAKLWPIGRMKVKLFDSAENVGAFDPTGSV